MCHMSGVMCHVSDVMCHVSHVAFFFWDKNVGLVSGGSVINGAYSVKFCVCHIGSAKKVFYKGVELRQGGPVTISQKAIKMSKRHR